MCLGWGNGRQGLLLCSSLYSLLLLLLTTPNLNLQNTTQHNKTTTHTTTTTPTQRCEVFYNPTLTPLRGRPEVFISGGFNRWRHAARHGPALMQPTLKGGVGFVKATLDVPADAHTLDLVFTDSAGAGGFADDNGGLDYHVPVEGAAGAAPALKVVHVAVEMAPIAKVRGFCVVVCGGGVCVAVCQ